MYVNTVNTFEYIMKYFDMNLRYSKNYYVSSVSTKNCGFNYASTLDTKILYFYD